MSANFLDCSTCVGHETEACDDCVVRFVVDRAVAGAPEPERVGDAEARAIRLFAEAGLLAEVRSLRPAS